MQCAINYSTTAAELVEQGVIDVDWFKCPAWPEVIAAAQKLRPSYAHFPLAVGSGIGDAINTETRQRADWSTVETLLVQTNTPFINLHLSPSKDDHPSIPVDTQDPQYQEWLTTQIIRDVEAVTQRFGAERVIVENDYDSGGRHLRPAFMPDVIHQVVTETGCGSPCDLSHARLAAASLGMPIEEYMQALPMAALREFHLTGIQYVGEQWVERLRQAEVPATTIQRLAGRWIDHLPFTEADWDVTQWCSEKLGTGAWATPWSVCVEYGGVGRLWEAVTDAQVIAHDLPHLRTLMFPSLPEQAARPHNER